ncbi:hypothetical protein K502DRAFT_352427 [Neoconidiobolus thromboides FSU 785]|nr:hypothetical protein K502DRAFT_352427 [Neoconidiobolus thromboides FSU 785]
MSSPTKKNWLLLGIMIDEGLSNPALEETFEKAVRRVIQRYNEGKAYLKRPVPGRPKNKFISVFQKNNSTLA